MNPFSDAGRAHPAVLGAVFVTAALVLSACTGTGRFSAAAVWERSGRDYVGHTCEHHWTAAEPAAQQWCETPGDAYLQGDGCEFGEGGPMTPNNV
jgi:hypothetical protein